MTTIVNDDYKRLAKQINIDDEHIKRMNEARAKMPTSNQMKKLSERTSNTKIPSSKQLEALTTDRFKTDMTTNESFRKTMIDMPKLILQLANSLEKQ